MEVGEYGERQDIWGKRYPHTHTQETGKAGSLPSIKQLVDPQQPVLASPSLIPGAYLRMGPWRWLLCTATGFAMGISFLLQSTRMLPRGPRALEGDGSLLGP